MIYLASPYSHPDPQVRESRHVAACKAAAYLMEQLDLVVYSPIAHSHPIEQHLRRAKPHEWWMRQCVAMLRRCEALYVLQLDGWEDSKGVGIEIHHARTLQMPIFACKSTGQVRGELE